MATVKNFVALNEEADNQIDYYHSDIRQIGKNNHTNAKAMLKKNKDFVKELNSVYDSVSELRGYMNSEQQRDLLVSAFILHKNKNKGPAQEVGLEIEDSENFDKFVERVIYNTRKTANKLGTKTPSIEEVDKLKEAKFSDEAVEELKSKDDEEDTEDDTDSEEEPDSEEPDDEETDSEEESEVDTSFPPEADDEDDDEPEEVDDDEPEPDSEEDDEEPKEEKPPVNKKDFPPPKEKAREIERYKEEYLSNLKAQFEKIEEPTKAQQRAYDTTRDSIEKNLNAKLKTAENAHKGYSIHATPSSAQKASTKAKIAAIEAKREGEKLVSKFKRSQMAGVVGRGAKKAKEIGTGVKNVATAAGKTRAGKLTRDALRKAGKKGRVAAQRGTARAKEEISRIQSNVQDKKTANTIGNFLGAEWKNKYLEALQNNDKEKAEQIKKTAENKATSAKMQKSKEERDREERLRRERLERLKSKNEAVKNYLKYLKEKDEVEVEPGKEFETITKNLDPNSAKKYKELSTSKEIEDRKKAPDILAKAAEAKRKKDEELKKQEKKTEQEVKSSQINPNEDRNSLIRKALRKPLYN